MKNNKLNKIIEQVLEVKITKPSEKILPISLDTFKQAYINWFKKEWGEENEEHVEEFEEKILECSDFEDMAGVLEDMGYEGTDQIIKDLFSIFIRK